jgi:sugar phosphate isomerase/epimerase
MFVMKFGICTNMHGNGADPAGLWLIEPAAKAGFDYLELPLAQIMNLGREAFERVLDKLSSCDIKCLRNNNFFPIDMRLTGPDVNEAGIDDYAGRALTCAHALGAGKVVFGSGPARNIPPGFPHREGKEQIVRLLRRLSSTAAQFGIVIVIEPLNRTESNVINTFEEGCFISSAVNRESVKVLVDYYHLVKENEPLEHIYHHGKNFLAHVHFAGDGVNRGYPVYEEKERYRQFLKGLKAGGYDDTVSLEARDDNPAAHMKPALDILRELWGEL